MKLLEVTYRHRNDFHWRGQCENCRHIERYGDGYADAFYCLTVIPHRYCPKCGKNSYGETPPEDLRSLNAEPLKEDLASPLKET